jgi:hypothetical protein
MLIALYGGRLMCCEDDGHAGGDTDLQQNPSQKRRRDSEEVVDRVMYY